MLRSNNLILRGFETLEEFKPKTAMERRKEMTAKKTDSHPWTAIFAMLMIVLMLAPIFLSIIGKF